MGFAPPKGQKPPKVKRSNAQNWLKGVVSSNDGDRMPIDGLLTSENTILDQNGTVRPRPSLRKYGPQPLGTVLGQIFEFKKQSPSGVFEIWMCSIQVVSGAANFYKAKGEDSTWTIVASGTTFNTSASVRFLQVQNKILILNGADNLTYYDIELGTLTRYSPISAPTAPTLDTNTGLTGTAFKVYYAITANSTVGETEGSGVLAQQVSIDRALWNKDTQSIKIKWNTVAGVKSWNVYMGISSDGAGQPTMYLIQSGIPADILTFTDNGTRLQQPEFPLPKNNSTAGPKAKRGEVINGRPWLVGDTLNPYLVWRGGDYSYELDFSPSNGGGYTPIGNGTKEVPISVRGFRDGKGDQRITVLTQSSNGAGKRFLISPTTIDIGSLSLIVWRVDEDTGSDGTDSPDAVVTYNNSLFYPSRDGFKTTGTKPQLQNVLSTDRISNTIQPDISLLNSKKMEGAVGLGYEGRIYWSLPASADKNNQIWVLDLDRDGAWMKPWNIKADWLWLYNDNAGKTHFLMLIDNKIYETTRVDYTSDDGKSFITSLASGQIPFSEDRMEWAKLIKAKFIVSRPRGRINFVIVANTKDGPITFNDTRDFTAGQSVVGWGEPSLFGIQGFIPHAWGSTDFPPTAAGPVSKEVKLKINKKCNWWSYAMNTNGTGIDYQLSEVTAEHVNIGVVDIDK